MFLFHLSEKRRPSGCSVKDSSSLEQNKGKIEISAGKYQKGGCAMRRASKSRVFWHFWWGHRHRVATWIFHLCPPSTPLVLGLNPPKRRELLDIPRKKHPSFFRNHRRLRSFFTRSIMRETRLGIFSLDNLAKILQIYRARQMRGSALCGKSHRVRRIRVIFQRNSTR